MITILITKQSHKGSYVFMMDLTLRKIVIYHHVAQRVGGIDRNDRYASRNSVFFDLSANLNNQSLHILFTFQYTCVKSIFSFTRIKFIWKDWMVFKDLYASRNVCFDATHCIYLMHPRKRILRPGYIYIYIFNLNWLAYSEYFPGMHFHIYFTKL